MIEESNGQLDKLLKYFDSVEAIDQDIIINVSESQLISPTTIHTYDITFRTGDALPPFRSFTGESMADVKAILKAHNHLDLKWYPADPE